MLRLLCLIQFLKIILKFWPGNMGLWWIKWKYHTVRTVDRVETHIHDCWLFIYIIFITLISYYQTMKWEAGWNTQLKEKQIFKATYISVDVIFISINSQKMMEWSMGAPKKLLISFQSQMRWLFHKIL